jgi:hypothetical protein
MSPKMQYHFASHLKYYYLKKGVKCKEKTKEIVFFSYKGHFFTLGFSF